MIPKIGKPAKRHWYSTLMVTMCIRFVLEAAISFRAIPKSVHVVFSSFAILQKIKIPCPNTILRWLTKVGLYNLLSEKEQADDWAAIADHTVQLGDQKCLVILGIRLSKLTGNPLTLKDMKVISIEVHKSSKAEIMDEALERAQKKVGTIEMVCADDGPDLRGGIERFCQRNKAGRSFDIVHKAATYLKKILNNQEQWKNFTTAATESKKKMQQSKAAHLAPPNQRTKSRFLNLEILVNWTSDALAILETPDHKDRSLLLEYCAWILDFKEFVIFLKQLVLATQITRQCVRENNLHKNTPVILESLLEELPLDMEAAEYAGRLIDFVSEECSRVPEGKVWIGSSEIIESLFGKVKHLEQDQCKGGFTSLILGAAACVGKIDSENVALALQKIKTKDVNAWVMQWIGTTLTSKRRAAFGFLRKKTKEISGQELDGIFTEISF